MRMADCLVIGYGNPLRGDDGVGWRAAELILAAGWPHTAVRQLHQLLPEVAQWLSEVNVAVLIDTAVSPAHPAGSIACREIEPEPGPMDPAAFTHHLTPERVLGMAHALYGRAPRTFLLTVVGGEFGYVEGFSTAVGQALPELTQQVIQLISDKHKARSET